MSFPTGVAFLLAGFTLFPLYESLCQAKMLQLMTGISGALYWLSNYIFDAAVYTLAWIIIAIAYVSFYAMSADAAGKSRCFSLDH